MLTVAEARREAKRIKAEITLGADPRAEARARKAVITYAELFESHVLPHLKLRIRSWDRSDEIYRLRLKAAFGGKRLNQITRHQIQSFHSALAAEGLAAATANHHLKVLRSSLNLARQWGMLEGENPAARIQMLHEDNKVERYMNDEELARLLNILRTDRNQGVCRVALFLLSTGCRLNEALSATWADVDIERRVFTIRATNSKSRKLRSVPLNDSAIEVLTQLETRGRVVPSSRAPGRAADVRREDVGPNPESRRAAAPEAARPAPPVRVVPGQRRADAVRGPGDTRPLEQQGDRALRPPEHEDAAGRGEQCVGEAQRGEVDTGRATALEASMLSRVREGS